MRFSLPLRLVVFEWLAEASPVSSDFSRTSSTSILVYRSNRSSSCSLSIFIVNFLIDRLGASLFFLSNIFPSPLMIPRSGFSERSISTASSILAFGEITFCFSKAGACTLMGFDSPYSTLSITSFFVYELVGTSKVLPDSCLGSSCRLF